MFADGSLMCKLGAKGGEAGWAVAQIHEATHELSCSAHGAMPISPPVQCRIMRTELWPLLQVTILSEPGARRSSQIVQPYSGVWSVVVLSGAKTACRHVEANLGTLPRHWLGRTHRFSDKM